MSHPAQQNFVRSIQTYTPNYFTNTRVLEVGSLNVNGTVRDFFKNCEYVGIDVAPGPCVDIVAQGQEFYSLPFDVTISCECLEHNPYWAETFLNMITLLKPNGLMIMSCATTGRPEHGTARTNPGDSPLTIAIGWNYYKNLTQEDFLPLLDFDETFKEWGFNTQGTDLYFYGIKK